MAIETTDLFVLQKNGGELRKASFKDIQDEVIDNITNSVRVTITATAGQTVFDVSPAEIASGSELVYLNGTLLAAGTDYDVTDTSEVTLATAAVLGDIFEIFCDNTVTGERQDQNLGYRESATAGEVTITDGSNAVIPAADATNAGLLTAADWSKLDGITDGAGANVNSDWNATSGPAEILNKPTIPTATSELTNDSGFITIDDVPETPEGGLPEAPDNGNQYARQNQGWEVVDVPTATSELTNDSGFITSADIPSPVVPGDGTLTIKNSDGSTAGSFTANQVTNTEITLPAGFSGDYNDLDNVPTQLRESITATANQTVFNLTQGTVVLGTEFVYLNGTLLSSGSDYTATENTITLNTGAVAGDTFEVITGGTIKPTIGNGNLTINNSDGSTAGTFTANQTGNTTIDLPDVTLEGINYTHPGTGAIERTLQSRLEEYASVKDFGAKGDNSNDTTAIDAALDWWVGGSYRHLHFPAGTYQYTGSKTIDFEHRIIGNVLTMNGAFNCTSTATRALTFTKFSGGVLQMNVYGGGYGGLIEDSDGNLLEDTFTEAEPKNGGTVFLTLRAPHTSEVEIEAVNYAGRVLHCTGLADDAPDKHVSGMSPIYMTIDLKGKGRLEGRIGQNFYGDTGQAEVLGAWGSVKIINDGNWYGSVFENCGDLRIDSIESGEFFCSAALEIRGCVQVHCGDIYLGETRSGRGGPLDLGEMDKWYDEDSGESKRREILLNIRESQKTVSNPNFDPNLPVNEDNFPTMTFTRLSSNIFIDKLNCLAGGTGVNIQMTDGSSPGVVINQFVATLTAVPINNYDSWASVAIRNISCHKCGVAIRKRGTGQSAVMKNQSYQRYDFLHINDFFYKDKSAIELQEYHGLVTITGNLRPWPIDSGLTGSAGMINVTGNSTYKENFNVHITNAVIDSGTGDYYCVKSVNYADGESNRVRVTDTLLYGNNIFDTTPSYVRGCIGASDTP